jgi:CRISPR system Cascade subunit CasD
MSGSAVLFLRLEGPLQSWGDSARWSVRGTRLEPTKSGVIGLIACAAGWRLDAAGDRNVRELASGVRFGVRADRPGTVLRDYHTVCGGVLSAEGKVKINATTREPETVVSERYYLADACFLAALRGPEELLQRIQGYLSRPVWVPFLGRRSCPPSAPLLPALPGHPSIQDAPDLYAALKKHPWIATRPELKEDAPTARLRYVIEQMPEEPAIRDAFPQMRRDQPASFSRRLFAERRVVEGAFRSEEMEAWNVSLQS